MKGLKFPKKKNRLYVFAMLAIAGVLVWAFITASMITRDFNRQQRNAQGESQEAVVSGIILTETKDAKKYWEIYGDTGEWNSDKSVAQLDGVLGNFYKDNEVSMSFKSSKGTYNSQAGDITLYEDTVVAIKGGITLKADKLHWIDSKSPIIAEGHVEIQKDNQLLSQANKIEISPTYENFKITGNTVSKVYEGK